MCHMNTIKTLNEIWESEGKPDAFIAVKVSQTAVTNSKITYLLPLNTYIAIIRHHESNSFITYYFDKLNKNEPNSIIDTKAWMSYKDYIIAIKISKTNFNSMYSVIEFTIVLVLMILLAAILSTAIYKYMM